MNQLIWSTIEVRIVCIVDEIEAPLEAYPPSIFEVFAYESLLQGKISKSYPIKENAQPAQSCGYPIKTTLQRSDKRTGKPPNFLEYD